MSTYEEFMIILTTATPGRVACTYPVGCLSKYIINQYFLFVNLTIMYFISRNRSVRQHKCGFCLPFDGIKEHLTLS